MISHNKTMTIQKRLFIGFCDACNFKKDYYYYWCNSVVPYFSPLIVLPCLTGEYPPCPWSAVLWLSAVNPPFPGKEYTLLRLLQNCGSQYWKHVRGQNQQNTPYSHAWYFNGQRPFDYSVLFSGKYLDRQWNNGLSSYYWWFTYMRC